MKWCINCKHNFKKSLEEPCKTCNNGVRINTMWEPAEDVKAAIAAINEEFEYGAISNAQKNSLIKRIL
jgi:hypothetical protein